MSTPGGNAFEALRSAVERFLPGDAGEELKHTLEATMRAHFEQMNLVTRDQLEIQEKVLRRTRERVAELEQQIERLEQQLKKKDSASR